MTNAARKHWIEEAENQPEATWLELGERQVAEEIWAPTWKHALADLGKGAWRCLFTPPQIRLDVAPNRPALEEHEWKVHHQSHWNS